MFLPSLKQKMNTTLTESTQSGEYFKYFDVLDFIRETNLGYESEGQVGSLDEKNGDKKSRISVLLTVFSAKNSS
jgi:hypothetical protein